MLPTLPYPRSKLGRDFGFPKAGPGISSWIVGNKVRDYAGEFFGSQRAKKLQQVQPDAYQNAQNAVDRMFGKDITSGNQFKGNFGQPLQNQASPNLNTVKTSNKQPKGIINRNTKKVQKQLKPKTTDSKFKSKTKRAASKFLKAMK